MADDAIAQGSIEVLGPFYICVWGSRHDCKVVGPNPVWDKSVEEVRHDFVTHLTDTGLMTEPI